MRVALHGVPQRVPSRRWARENLQFAATIIADPLNAPLPRRFAILKHFGWLSHRRVLPIAGEPCRRSLSAERLTLFLPPLLAAPRAAFDLLIMVGDHFRLDYHRKEEGGGDAIDCHNHVRVVPECVHSRSSPNNQGCGLVFNALFAKRWP